MDSAGIYNEAEIQTADSDNVPRVKKGQETSSEMRPKMGVAFSTACEV